MNTRIDLENAVVANWRNKTAALILADYICEHSCCTRWQALRAVAALRNSQRDAEEMAEATGLVRARTLEARRIREAVREAIRPAIDTVCTLYVFTVRGYRPPRVSAAETADTNADLVIVSVGARWILAYVGWLRGHVDERTGLRQTPFRF